MLIGSLGTVMGSLVMFLQGSLYLYEAWDKLFEPGDVGGKQLTVPVPEAVEFLSGIVLVIFAYGVATGFVFTLAEGFGKKLRAWMNVAGAWQSKETLTDVVVVVLIIIFAHTLVEAEGRLPWSRSCSSPWRCG
jgi:uncharacterized membrane protein YqhA